MRTPASVESRGWRQEAGDFLECAFFPCCGVITVQAVLLLFLSPLCLCCSYSDQGTKGKKVLGKPNNGCNPSFKKWPSLVKGFPKCNYVISFSTERKTWNEDLPGRLCRSLVCSVQTEKHDKLWLSREMHEAEFDLRSCARVYMQGWKNIFLYSV